MEIVLVRWPTEASRRVSLHEAGAPCLLLVESGPPPEVTGPGEDWIRVPASDADIAARVELLRRRLQPVAGHDTEHPVLDEHGILRLGDRWVSLSPLEARLVAALVERPAAAIPRQRLIEAGWPPPGRPSRNALDAHILRLRRRLQTVGLTIRTIRARGYLLDRSYDAPHPKTVARLSDSRQMIAKDA